MANQNEHEYNSVSLWIDSKFFKKKKNGMAHETHDRAVVGSREMRDWTAVQSHVSRDPPTA